jgi:tRNA uridine 5-carboxymethylaminomethyl modification enzyme
MSSYDVVIIGAGHAGIEAALAASRMGCKTLMLTLSADTIGAMSCNPAIGGVGKGQLVKEIDALGGEMAKAADACAIQFRILNASKGAAVQSSRAQIDLKMYNRYMTGRVKAQENLTLKEAEVRDLIIRDNRVYAIKTEDQEEITAKTVIVASGTCLGGLIHIGLNHRPGGRLNEPASVELEHNLRKNGFQILRFKTGTCARLDKETIDFSPLKIQAGDERPRPFSFSAEEIKRKQVPCHITYTNQKTHEIIRRNLDRSPLYAGVIKSTGVRYCPSIEDKVVRFADRGRHQVFLEPQGDEAREIYPNGISTSLPEDVQLEFIRSIEGLEKAEVLRFGYGIEHSVVEPTQLYPTLETKRIKNLYFAGQINGTTGYEEAAAQGLAAGINAALRAKDKEPLILDRSSSYIGVLIDDLTTKGTNEPYRMFTSRVEYRLILREDNADLRLGKIGYALGLVSREDYCRIEDKARAIKEGITYLRQNRLKPPQGLSIRKPLTQEEFLKRPGAGIADLQRWGQFEVEISQSVLEQIEIEVKYAGFIQRQLAEVERFKNLEKVRLPQELDYSRINSLSREIKEKLQRFRPINLGQASRISGVTPAAISLLMVYLKKLSLQSSRDSMG